MKIAYILENYFNWGGMERNVSLKANWMVNNTDFEISIIVANQQGKQPFFEIDSRVTFIDLQIQAKSKKRFSWANPYKEAWKLKLQEFLSINHYDILVSYCGMEMEFLPDICNDTKIVAEFQFNYYMYEYWGKTANRNLFVGKIKGWLATRKAVKLARRYDRFVALTATDVKNWERECKTNNITYIHNSLTLSDSRQADLSSKTVCALGRFDIQKGFDYLIEVWKLVNKKHSDWKLIIYGEGVRRRPILEKMIFDAGLQDVVSLPGATTEVAKRLSESSIFAFSSRAEGFGLVLVEAMSCGLPVVTFDCPIGPAEVVLDGKCGFVVPLADVQSMADKICVLIEDESLRKNMSLAALERSKDFELNKIMRQWVDLYNSVVG